MPAVTHDRGTSWQRREQAAGELTVEGHLHAAVRHLARAAAVAELSGQDAGASAAWMFFLARSLCEEIGGEYTQAVSAARRYAADVMPARCEQQRAGRSPAFVAP